MPRRWASIPAAGLGVIALLAGCSSRTPPAQPSAAGSTTTVTTSGPDGPATTSGTSSPTSSTVAPPTLPPAPSGHVTTQPSAPRQPADPTRPPIAPPTTKAGTSPTQAAIQIYQDFLYDLSGLDDNLNQAWVTPLSQVTTLRLAQATVRTAAAILDAHEHGVGTLRDDHLHLTFQNPTTALIADCQDERDFYLASDATNAPDPAVTRADFAGAAQVIEVNGGWQVDVFSTTHTECTY